LAGEETILKLPKQWFNTGFNLSIRAFYSRPVAGLAEQAIFPAQSKLNHVPELYLYSWNRNR